MDENFSKDFLEKEIQELNDWLSVADKTHPNHREVVHKRDYYVLRLIKLEE